jgi:transposase InsO family protein
LRRSRKERRKKRVLREEVISVSMTDGNRCYQNAPTEQVNGILKNEFDLDAIFLSIYAAQYAVATAIAVYNTRRDHWRLDLRTPDDVFQNILIMRNGRPQRVIHMVNFPLARSPLDYCC